MPAIENRSEGFWWAKQTAKGTPAGVAFKKGRKVGGTVGVAPARGSEAHSDGKRFGDRTHFVDAINATGAPVLQAQPGVVAHFAYLISGQESVTAGYDYNEHLATPGDSAFWFSVWKSVGKVIGPLRQRFNDCRLQSIRIEGSSQAKVAKITPTFISLDGGITFAADPVVVADADEPMLYTEAEGTFEINGEVFTGHSSFAVVIADAANPWMGDSVRADDVTFGIATVTIEGITLLVNQQGFELYNELIYGHPTPPAGSKPLDVIPPTGSYAWEMRRGTVWSLIATGSTAGDFTLDVNGEETAAIAFNANNAAIKAAIEALPGVLAGEVEVVGGVLPGTAVQIVFKRRGVAVTADSTGLTGGTAVLTDRGAHRSAGVDLAALHWNPDVSIEGNPEGGATELSLGAEVEDNGVDPIYAVRTRCADVAFS
jgi:hypothetical protein